MVKIRTFAAQAQNAYKTKRTLRFSGPFWAKSPNFGDFPINSNKVFTINNLYDTEKLENFIEQSKPKSVGVIGGGFIAIEMVEAFKSKGLDTHLIHRRDSLSKIFEKEVSGQITAEI